MKNMFSDLSTPQLKAIYKILAVGVEATAMKQIFDEFTRDNHDLQQSIAIVRAELKRRKEARNNAS